MATTKLRREEHTKEVTLERAKELLKNKKIGDEELTMLMNNLRAFCRILIDIHQTQEKQKKVEEHCQSIELREAA
jgi:hypothetical protein